MNLRKMLSIVLILILSVFLTPWLAKPVDAANSMITTINTVESRSVKVTSTVYADAGQIEDINIRIMDGPVTLYFVKGSSSPLTLTYRVLQPNHNYYVVAYCNLKFPAGYISASNVNFKTLYSDPSLSASFDQINTTSVRLLASVHPNSHTLKTVKYTLHRASDGVKIAEKTFMTNVTSGGTRAETISGLTRDTQYKLYLYLETALGWKKTFGYYTFKTARFAIVTGIPIITLAPTATPKPSPTPTPSAAPTPTPSAAPTASPTPASTSGTSAATTATPAATTTAAETTAPPEESTSAATTGSQPPNPSATAAPSTQQGTGTSLSSQSETTSANGKDPDEGNAIPWGIIAVALVAVAGLGFGLGGFLMYKKRGKG